ncbi:hypothetical protein JOD17_001323 [Geomicrobium sediminis]|uniref:Uncharacterized protein n=1 Tax=Geomicrobium sediminis TaxID=1347788 RepID=A0ABS2PAY1_9BACL|nr:hypothetical protein [Geomicrobium sediminis]
MNDITQILNDVLNGSGNDSGNIDSDLNIL